MVKLVKIDEAPIERKYTQLSKIIDEFMTSDAKVARIEYEKEHYCTVRSCVGAFNVALKRKRLFPSVRAYSVGDCAYIEKVTL